MDTFDESAVRRQPAGVTGAGQFATQPKAEADVMLTGAAAGQEPAVSRACQSMANALGVSPESVTMDIKPDGRRASLTHVTMTANDRDTTVALRFTVDDDGATSELGATATWQTPELADYGYDDDAAVSPYDPQRPADPDTVASLVADITRQARQQRAFDQVLNNPQLDNRPLTRQPHTIVRVEAVVVDGRNYVKVTDGEHSNARPVTLRVSDQGITAARIDTDYGPVTVTDEHELENALTMVDARLSGSLDLRPASYGREHLQGLLAQAYGRAG